MTDAWRIRVRCRRNGWLRERRDVRMLRGQPSRVIDDEVSAAACRIPYAAWPDQGPHPGGAGAGGASRERRIGAALLGHRPDDRRASAVRGLGRGGDSAVGSRTAKRACGGEGVFRAKHRADDRLLPDTFRSGRVLPQAAAKLRKPNLPQAAADLPGAVLWAIPWFHHVVLMEKVKDVSARVWYMEQTLANGWSRSVLLAMIQSQVHKRQGKAITNFERLLPPPESDLARETLKDPYVFDFLTLAAPFHERELEAGLLRQLEKFLLELGQGFAFVGSSCASPSAMTISMSICSFTT